MVMHCKAHLEDKYRCKLICLNFMLILLILLTCLVCNVSFINNQQHQICVNIWTSFDFHVIETDDIEYHKFSTLQSYWWILMWLRFMPESRNFCDILKLTFNCKSECFFIIQMSDNEVKMWRSVFLTYFSWDGYSITALPNDCFSYCWLLWQWCFSILSILFRLWWFGIKIAEL